MGLTLTLAIAVALEAPNAGQVREQAESIVAALQAKFQSFVLHPATCGVAGDGVTDDTRALQSCVDSLPEYATLDGEGKNYLVSALQLKSRMRLRAMHLVKFAGSENMTSPITLDGRTDPKQDVLIENVAIDGQRAHETAMLTPSAEDGGRHCFRIVGRISSFVMLNSQGSYCGTDGLQLGGHHATGSDQPDDLPLQNIVIRNSTFDWNRRVGIAFEGAHNLYFIDVNAQANGRSLPGLQTRTSGSHCAHIDGACFGSGVWTENDHDAAGGSFDSVYLLNVAATGNFSRGFYAYSNSGPLVTGFRAKSNLAILNSHFDAGTAPTPGNPMAIQFSSSSPDGAGAVYETVAIKGSLIEGTIAARSLTGLTVADSKVTAGFLGFLEYFDDVQVSNVERSGDFVSSRWLRPDGSVNAVVRY